MLSARSSGVQDRLGRVLESAKRLTAIDLGHHSRLGVVQKHFAGLDDEVLLLPGQVGPDQVEAIGCVDHDALVEYAIKKVDQFHSPRFAYQSHCTLLLITASPSVARMPTGLRATRHVADPKICCVVNYHDKKWTESI